MNLRHWSVAASLGLCLGRVCAADAVSRIDYSQRNAPFVAQPSVTPTKANPAVNRALQEARVEKSVRAKQSAVVGERRAGVTVAESDPKRLIGKDSQRPLVNEQPVSAFNRRIAAVSTAGAAHSPPLVAKYQDSLAAASSRNMARFPALDQGVKATINRFVFRKNAPQSATAILPDPVIPAAGGSPVRK